MKTNTLFISIPTVKSVIFPKEMKFYVYISISMDNRALFMIVKIGKQLRFLWYINGEVSSHEKRK